MITSVYLQLVSGKRLKQEPHDILDGVAIFVGILRGHSIDGDSTTRWSQEVLAFDISKLY